MLKEKLEVLKLRQSVHPAPNADDKQAYQLRLRFKIANTEEEAQVDFEKFLDSQTVSGGRPFLEQIWFSGNSRGPFQILWSLKSVGMPHGGISMFEIGSLIGISKSFLETFSLLKKLISDSRSNTSEKAFDEMRNTVNQFQTRLEGLAIQLDQTERLTRMVPAWEAYANQIQAWKDVVTIPDAEAQQIHVSLRQLIDSSIRDQFSGTFFRTEFDGLPDMKRRIDIFRAHVTNIDRTCSGIPAGNLQAFRALWSSISTEFNNLKNAAYDIRRQAEDLQAELINELLRSSQEARKYLSQL